MRRLMGIWLTVLVLFWLAAPALAARTFVDGDWLRTTSAVVSIPLTGCAWVYRTGLAVEQGIWSLHVGTNDHRIALYVGSNNALVLLIRDTTATTLSPGSVASNAWQLLCGVVTTTELFTYRNTNKSGPTAHARTPTGMTATDIGRHAPHVANLEWNGSIGPVMFWNSVLSDTEVAALVAGVHPRKIRPAALVSCPPLYATSAEGDACAPRSWTLNGSPGVAATRPPVGLFSHSFGR